MADNHPVKPELKPVATTADGRDITRPYVDALGRLEPQDTVLALRGNGNYEIYREVLRDDQVAATFQQRRLSVVSRELDVVPGGPRARDKAAATFIKDQLAALDFDGVTDKMLYGRFYGYAVAECMWARDGKYITLPEVRVRDRRRFAFDGDFRLRLLTTANQYPGELMPERRFWQFAVGADHDDEPYGLGLAHWLYWPVFFKRNGMKFWLVFLEKFGQPTAKGTYPANALEPDQKKLLAALEAIKTDSGIIMPEGMAVELIEAARSGTGDYVALHSAMNAAVAKVVLGQTQTTEATGGQYKSEVQMEVRKELTKADADLVCGSFNDQVVTWLTEWNFPGAAPPKVWRNMEEPEDLGTAAERDSKLFTIGYRPTPERIEATYGEGYEEVPASTFPPAAEFAEGDEAQPAHGEVDRVNDAVDPHLTGWIDQVKALVDSADSLDAIRDGLIKLYPEMSLDDYASAFADALAAAELAGRAEILDEARADR